MKSFFYGFILLFCFGMSTLAQGLIPWAGMTDMKSDPTALADRLSQEPAMIEADSANALPATAERSDPSAIGWDRKSIKKAFFLSLLLPGSGEYYVGQKGYTRGFLAAEGLIWSFALFSNFQGRMWRDDYIGYAAQEAGSNANRRDERYYKDIYEWPNSDWYNEYQWVLARDLYPDDPQAQAAYVADKLYAATDAWEWTTMEEWGRFRSLRVKSESAYRRVTYAMGAAVLNHLLSAVNAARMAKRYNNRRARKLSWDLDLCPSPDGSLTLRLNGRF